MFSKRDLLKATASIGLASGLPGAARAASGDSRNRFAPINR